MGKIRLFITGMGGLAGRALANHALTKNYLVGGIIRHSFPQELKILTDQNLLKYYSVDLKDLDETKKAIEDFQPDVVVHLAGKTLGGADKQIYNPQVYTENIRIFQNVLSAVKNLSKPPRFILTSGCIVYNRVTSSDFITEISAQSLPEIDSKKQPYRASRLDQEKLVAKENSLDYVITRPTQFSGPGKIPGVVEWYIANEISKIIRGQTDKIRVKNRLGEVDILDVRDVARAYLTIIEKGSKGEIYHISSGSPTTVESLIKLFLEVAGLDPSKYQIQSTDAEETIYFRFSPQKLNKLGWSPQFSLEDALISYWEYFQSQK